MKCRKWEDSRKISNHDFIQIVIKRLNIKSGPVESAAIASGWTVRSRIHDASRCFLLTLCRVKIISLEELLHLSISQNEVVFLYILHHSVFRNLPLVILIVFFNVLR